MPLDSGALGKVLLAFAPAEILEEVLAVEVSNGGNGSDPTRDDGRLRSDLAEIAENGIARSVGEVVGNAVFVAAPIFREDGIVAAIGVIGPETRCGPAWQKRVNRLLPAAASSVVSALRQGAAT